MNPEAKHTKEHMKEKEPRMNITVAIGCASYNIKPGQSIDLGGVVVNLYDLLLEVFPKQSSEPIPLPCPFCRNSETCFAEPVNNGLHCVHCGICSSNGPLRKAHDEAINAWNYRPSK